MEYEIKPKEKLNLGLRELAEYRELLYFFIWRDVKVKYKQTVLGVLWVVLQPVVLMLVFTFLLGSKYKTDLNGLNYPLFVLSGFLCWNIFSGAISGAGNSMVTNAGIIKKIYFPRLIIPVSAVLGAFVDFFVGLAVYAGALLYFHPAIHLFSLLYVPAALLLVFFAAFGAGTFIAALNVKYRDFRYLLPFLVQALLFVSPVFLLQKTGSATAQAIFACNPMYAPLELFRAHLQGYELNQNFILISITSNLIWTFAGLLTFRKTERYFADLA